MLKHEKIPSQPKTVPGRSEMGEIVRQKQMYAHASLSRIGPIIPSPFGK